MSWHDGLACLAAEAATFSNVEGTLRWSSRPALAGVVARLEVVCRPRDAWRRGHEGGFERAVSGRGHAAVFGRTAVVQAGDGLVGDVREICGRDGEEVGELDEEVGGPAAHLMFGQRVGVEPFLEAEDPAGGAGQGLDPGDQAARAAEVDAAVTLDVDGVRDDHGQAWRMVEPHGKPA